MLAMSTATFAAGERLAAQLATIPAVDIALLSGGRIADLGCGDGATTVAVARAYPEALVDGFERDAAAIDAARAHARAARVAGRVAFRNVDASSVRPSDLPAYAVVLAPAHLGATAERLAGEHGIVVRRDAGDLAAERAA
jgi:trans-aconitate methyltransferase